MWQAPSLHVSLRLQTPFFPETKTKPARITSEANHTSSRDGSITHMQIGILLQMYQQALITKK
jgi:hypothetical protein